jgi:CubicO group peptidase (beta-lactamase class C family)/lysophospholipase L1-like esterase
MKKLLVLAGLLLCLVPQAAAEPTRSLPRSAPEAQGVSSAAVLAFVDEAERSIDSLHSFMLIRHGHVVAEGWWAPYNRDTRHALYSLTKSFTSTAVGIAIAEGKLRIDDPVVKFFPDVAPAKPDGELADMRLSDLLRMSTGQETEPPFTTRLPWTKAFLAHPVPFKPGTHFLYNTSATYMASAMLQKATGEKLIDYLQPRLFGPLGIEDPAWETSDEGISIGGYGLSLRTEDIAKFGQLYLQRGNWQGKQLVPTEWIAAATSLQTANGSNPQSDWDQGYGYQFWRCRHGAYRGDGAYGQFCIVLPKHDAVIVVTSGVPNMQAVLNVVWDKLLPAFEEGTLPADEAVAGQLAKRLGGLALPTPTGDAAPTAVAGKTFRFAPNQRKLESLAIETDGPDSVTTLVAVFDGQERRVAFGRGHWHSSRAAWGTFPDQPVAAIGAWSDPQTFTAKLCFVETPFTISLQVKLNGDEVRVASKLNIGFDPAPQTELIGSASGTPPRIIDPTRFDRWEPEIAAYEAADRASPPAKGGILFIGSSTIRLWTTLQQDFPQYRVINRGFGGSEIVDSTHFAERIIFPYEPKQIFLRAGGNDIHNGRSPEEVAADFAAFVKKIHERLPDTEIAYIGVNPAPVRWDENEKYQTLNGLIRELADSMPRVSYVDAYDFPLDPEGKARTELFVADRLHLNAFGYDLLAERVRPFLLETD